LASVKDSKSSLKLIQVDSSAQARRMHNILEESSSEIKFGCVEASQEKRLSIL